MTGTGTLATRNRRRSPQTRLTSDDMGRVVVATLPDAGKSTYWYDAAGNLRSRTDAAGIKATYLYDFLNRLTMASFPAFGEDSAYSITYGYDQRPNGKGRLTDISDLSGTTMLNYNSSWTAEREDRNHRREQFYVFAGPDSRRPGDAQHLSKRPGDRLRANRLCMPGEQDHHEPQQCHDNSGGQLVLSALW